MQLKKVKIINSPPIISIQHPLLPDHFLVIDGNHRTAAYIFGLHGFEFSKEPKSKKIKLIKNDNVNFKSKFQSIKSIIIPSDIILLTNQNWTDGNDIDDYLTESLFDVLHNKVLGFDISRFLNTKKLDINCANLYL